MIAPQNHPREQERLQAVGETGLSGQTDSEYDHFVLIASTIAEVPISIFTILDEKRQWFRARTGIAASETPRSASFCGHAILDAQKPLIVEDAIFDMRFCDNPLVVNDPGIRFYAGVPLCAGKDGLPIGTLCVIDRKPRTLDPGRIAALVALGRILETNLTQSVKIRRLNASLEECRNRLSKMPPSVFKR